MSKSIHVREVDDDDYWVLKRMKVESKYTNWRDFFLDKVLENED